MTFRANKRYQLSIRLRQWDRKLKEGAPRPGPAAVRVSFDNREAGRQTRAHARATGRCRVEWLKETKQSFRARPDAGVLPALGDRALFQF
jgi:hypothetical protein